MCPHLFLRSLHRRIHFRSSLRGLQGNWALCHWPSSTKLGHRVGHSAWSAERTCITCFEPLSSCPLRCCAVSGYWAMLNSSVSGLLRLSVPSSQGLMRVKWNFFTGFSSCEHQSKSVGWHAYSLLWCFVLRRPFAAWRPFSVRKYSNLLPGSVTPLLARVWS